VNIIEKAVEKLEKELESELESELGHERDQTQQAERAAARRNGAGAEPRPAAPVPSLPAAEPSPASAASEPAPAATAEGPAAAATARTSRQVRLDLDALAAQGFITPEHSHNLIAEEHRLLKRPLLRRATAGDPEHVARGNLVIVTSSLPGEGKTFVAINLAMSLAMEMDRTVLLVDSDVAKSDVSRILGLRAEQGLSSYLAGEERDLSRLLLRTNVDKLTVLPSGPHHPKLAEMLASEQMSRLVAELSQRYPDRIVVFDSPPLLATSGAGILSGLMGQVVMVVEAVRTPQRAVREALRRLEVAGARNVTMLLNKQRGVSGHSYAYGYSYGYGYGYGADARAAEPG